MTEQPLRGGVRHDDRAAGVELEDAGRDGVDEAQQRRRDQRAGADGRVAEVTREPRGLAQQPGVRLDQRRVDALRQVGVQLEPRGPPARVGD
ncbi:hypothetical protein [Nannocystis pusilla]|uniref:hypothetical protein n=1 Tax=Nannocystis pusilla TaxID=889268 RepID=UPI003B7C1C5F